MAAFTSQAQNDDALGWFASIGTSASQIWIGVTDAVTEGSWLLPDGTPASYFNWASGEPNDDGGEDCAQMYVDSGFWNDDSCAGPGLYPFVCARSKTCPSCPAGTASSDGAACIT
eukprot:3934379-Rhodomonas_salina.1